MLFQPINLRIDDEMQVEEIVKSIWRFMINSILFLMTQKALEFSCTGPMRVPLTNG